MSEKLVNISTFAGMVCADGHVDPTASKTCNVLIRGRKCGAKMGRPKVTIRVMCKQGRIPGAVMPGNEWLINLDVATRSDINWRGRGSPKKDEVNNGN